MLFKQRTMAAEVSCDGVGLHSGNPVRMTLKPAPINYGIRFIRTDLPDAPEVKARFNGVIDTSLATVIGDEGCIISTIEHLMATFAGLSLDNVMIELDSYEVPIMDGSAGPFSVMINTVGIIEQEAPRYYFVIKEPIELIENDKFVLLHPDMDFKIKYSIEFEHPIVRKQTYCIDMNALRFENEISNARTFGFLHEVEYMKQYGLARGGSLENAIVLGPDNVINKEGLRYEDEFVRHKILDCIGDFSLLGMPIIGSLTISKSGHALNHAFLEKFFDNKQAWETCSSEEIQQLREDL